MTTRTFTAPIRATPVLLLAASLAAQNIPVPLNYNFNGIVHSGESSLPDDPNGYRSISDRGLDFTAGVPAAVLLANYQLVATAGALDIVHLGNRNTVTGGLWAFDIVPDGDDVGIQPAWLTNVDQTGPQVTALAQPLPVTATTTASFLYQISDGGGTFDVTISFQSGSSVVATLGGGDWFGGPFFGASNVDSGVPGAGLSITEGTVDLSSNAGEIVTAIGFSNRSNAVAGYAILAATFNYPIEPRRVNQIPLAYNFNGIVHSGESGLPDDPNGYRSISDRGLDFSLGVPSDPVLDKYEIIAQPGALDIVHLGNRNTVDNGTRIFDPTPDGDDIGIQPNWLPIVDQTGPQITILATPILLDSLSTASGLFQISNGGGTFDVAMSFLSGTSAVATVGGGDWFGGAYAGTFNTDSGLPGANLSIVERSLNLAAVAGEILTAISFANRSNTNAGYAILAMNVSGCLSCATAGGVSNFGGGNGPTMSTTSNGNLGCDLEWTVAGATPNAPLGFIALGLGQSPAPLAVFFSTCSGTIHLSSPVPNLVVVDGSGVSTLTLSMPPQAAFCGAMVTGQYAELVAAACPILLSDALGITIGN